MENDIVRRDGLTLINNGRALIVDDTVGNTIFAFDVLVDEGVKNKRPFAKLHDVGSGKGGVNWTGAERANRLAFENHYLACPRCASVVASTDEYVRSMRNALRRLRTEEKDSIITRRTGTDS